MARIAGVDLPKEKRIDVALEYIYGIGRPLSQKILKRLKDQVDPSTRVKNLTEQQIGLIGSIVTKEFKVEGELRREIQQSIQNYVEIGNYLNSLPKETPKYVIVNAAGVDVRGIPMPIQTVMFITKTYLPKWQKEKNLKK